MGALDGRARRVTAELRFGKGGVPLYNAGGGHE
jgi:hypothetical protein